MLTNLKDRTAAIQELKNTIEELTHPLSQVLDQVDSRSDGHTRALQMLMSELSMASLLLATADKPCYQERKVINDLHQAVYGSDLLLVTADDYATIYRELLRRYPKVRISLNHAPHSILYLESYDKENSTDYARKAKEMFLAK
ncbi:MAG: hypothetical protein M3410_13665 [Acidobacteriota bacterium]|nr:hypothetical protein [Acidobacteriota bacterium]